jgi:multicomponent Na+:H+ antiporter subunit B
MNAYSRNVLFTFSALIFAALLVGGISELPVFGNYPGPYGDIITASAPQDRRVTNVPTAVNFDYRGFDTLGEEYILFISVAGLALLLRKETGYREKSPQPGNHHPLSVPDGTVQWIGFLLFGPLAVFGMYVILHGQLTPGGGFHGGVIIGAAWLLVYIASGQRLFHRLTPKKLVDAIEASGAAMYAIIGLLAFISGGLFLQNILPLGTPGDITSGGTIALINLFVGIEVATAFMLLFSEFIETLRTD